MPPPVRGPADRARRLLQRAAAFLMTIALLVPVIAKAGDDMVAVLDFKDFTRLDGRKLLLGSHGYTQMWDDKYVTLVHRWVMGAKPKDGRIVDHLNGERLDDRRTNLPHRHGE